MSDKNDNSSKEYKLKSLAQNELFSNGLLCAVLTCVPISMTLGGLDTFHGAAATIACVCCYVAGRKGLKVFK